MLDTADHLLIDLGGMDACCTNHALDSLAKAISGEDGPHDIWEKHQSPVIQTLVELFTQRGLLMLGHVQKALEQWAGGALHTHAQPVKPPGFVQNWTAAESDLAHIYLTSLAPEAFTFDDWGLLVDYLLHTYMPLDVLKTEAEWFATRSSIMGRVQAVMGKKAATVAQLDAVMGALPLTVAGAQQAFNFGTKMDAVMEYGNARCMAQVVALKEGARAKIKKTILDHTFAKMSGDPAAGGQALQSKLFDDFATMNRDWRRIAITEAGENANQGFLSTLVPGARVRRIEQYKGACPFCKKINGVVMEVVDPAAEKKDGDKQVWVGKTNINRSAAPRKRVGTELIERTGAEMWWIAAGVQHPHCQGTWDAMPDAGAHDDPDFQKWLDQHFHKAGVSHTKGNAAV